jgi:uncharacterized membrane protein
LVRREAGSLNVVKSFLLFSVREGFALGVALGLAIALFMPAELVFKLIGLAFAVLVSLLAAIYQFRRRRRGHRNVGRGKRGFSAI